MKNEKKAYTCLNCGAFSVKWQGQCPDCAAWNSLNETIAAKKNHSSLKALELKRLNEINEKLIIRYNSGFDEFDRVLGGGLVPGSVILVGGDPGIGKSTLLQQIASNLSLDLTACYITGEESINQVAQRSSRIGTSHSSVLVIASTSLEQILHQIKKSESRVVIIDSIQTMVSSETNSSPGSISQLKECVGELVQFAKQNEISVLLIGHVTKEGAIAGPKIVEHMVDTVIYFENDLASRYTVIRTVKNRFGATNEMGVFAMTESGFKEVKNPSAIFLSNDYVSRPGSLVSVAWEGSRPLLFEMQALVSETHASYTKRLAQGIDQARLPLLTAVLQKYTQISLAQFDIFINVVGGLRLDGISADLPAIIAIISSYKDLACKKKLISFGEVGLAGEIRPVKYGTERLIEAAKQGFTSAVIPRANLPRKKIKNMELMTVSKLTDAIDFIF
jgi:DNA repair protein RadA/Sms